MTGDCFFCGGHVDSDCWGDKSGFAGVGGSMVHHKCQKLVKAPYHSKVAPSVFYAKENLKWKKWMDANPAKQVEGVCS